MQKTVVPTYHVSVSCMSDIDIMLPLSVYNIMIPSDMQVFNMHS